jgi:hypothetical protein
MLLPSFSPIPEGSTKFTPSLSDIPDSYDYRDEGGTLRGPTKMHTHAHTSLLVTNAFPLPPNPSRDLR